MNAQTQRDMDACTYNGPASEQVKRVEDELQHHHELAAEALALLWKYSPVGGRGTNTTQLLKVDKALYEMAGLPLDAYTGHEPRAMSTTPPDKPTPAPTPTDAGKQFMSTENPNAEIEASNHADFIRFFSLVSDNANINARRHGFWDVSQKDTTFYKLSRIALMHSELIKCVEGIRKNLSDDHLPKRSMEVAELADTIIRIMDYASGYDLPLAEVIIDKMTYNSKRPHMHGDKKA